MALALAMLLVCTGRVPVVLQATLFAVSRPPNGNCGPPPLPVAEQIPAVQLIEDPSPCARPSCAFVAFWIAGEASARMKFDDVPLFAVGPAVAVGFAPVGYAGSAAYVPSPRKKVVVLLGHAGIAPCAEVVTVGNCDGAAVPATAPKFSVAYVPSPRKNVVVLFGQAGNAPCVDAVAVAMRDPASVPVHPICHCTAWSSAAEGVPLSVRVTLVSLAAVAAAGVTLPPPPPFGEVWS